YTVTASSPGFLSAQKNDVRVILGQTVTVDFELQVGRAGDSVLVTATASTEDSTSTTTGVTRLSEELRSLPLAVGGGPRTSAMFLRTVSGINFRDPSLQATSPVIYGVGDAGGFRSAAGYTVDGVDSNGMSNSTMNFNRFINLAQQS